MEQERRHSRIRSQENVLDERRKVEKFKKKVEMIKQNQEEIE